MIATQLILLFTIINTISSGQITNNGTKAVWPESKNSFKFEGQSDEPQSYGLIRFEDEDRNKYYNYEDNNEYNKPQNVLENTGQNIKFEEENRIEYQRPNNHQKKKRRRRKPKRIISNGVPNYQNGTPGPFGVPGPVYPGPIYPGQRYPPPYQGPLYKPRPSPTSAALSAVTEALTSIALYDDRQCVPRLLCEAAGGTGGNGGTAGGIAGGTGEGTASGLLQSIIGLQPLLTLLAAYNGISSSPLFVFGRAVFLGMTSKANPGTCRYAYPDCPNDPEQLVHYLNNHNGGFFRFFAAPELNQQQGLEQFYNQLSGQNYGYYQPQQNLGQAGYGQLQQQNYQYPQLQGAYQQQQNQYQYQAQNLQQQNLYQNQNLQQQGFYQNVPQSVYQNPNLQNLGHQRPNLYGNSYGFYGKGYPYQQNANFNKFKSKEIQKRIQNSPSTEYVKNNVENSKWLFPESSISNVNNEYNHVRIGKVLKFPGSNVNSVKAAEGFIFPGIQSNREYLSSNIEAETDDFRFDVASAINSYRNENQYNYGLYYGSKSNNYDDSNIRTLYIVRGNGDPNNPEIVHLAPGQNL